MIENAMQVQTKTDPPIGAKAAASHGAAATQQVPNNSSEKVPNEEAGGTLPVGQGGGGEEAKQSNYERMLSNLKAKYADRGFESDDEYFGAAMEGYDAEHEYAKQMRADNAELGEIMQEDPDFADFAREVAGGGSIGDAMRHMPDDVREWGGDGDGRRGVHAELLKSEAAHRQELEAMLAEQQSNLAKSEESLRRYIGEQGLSEQEGAELMTFLQEKVLDPIGRGLISPELLEMMDKGRHYDEDIATAQKAGRVAGRNEQIVERRQRLDHGLDGLPAGGKVGTETQETPIDGEVEYFKTLRGRSPRGNGYEDFYK